MEDKSVFLTLKLLNISKLDKIISIKDISQNES